MCLSRKPWLLIVEFMEYKDLGVVIRNIKKQKLQMRINELLAFPVQIADGGAYLAEASEIYFSRFSLNPSNRNELSIVILQLETSSSRRTTW